MLRFSDDEEKNAKPEKETKTKEVAATKGEKVEKVEPTEVPVKPNYVYIVSSNYNFVFL